MIVIVQFTIVIVIVQVRMYYVTGNFGGLKVMNTCEMMPTLFLAF